MKNKVIKINVFMFLFVFYAIDFAYSKIKSNSKIPIHKSFNLDENLPDWNIQNSIYEWINSSENSESLYVYSKFQFGIPIALNQIFESKSKWILVKQVKYNYNFAAPIIEFPLVVQQNPKVVKNIPLDVNYFIYLKSNPKIRLVVSSQQTWAFGEIAANIYYNKDNSGVDYATELSKDIENELRFRSAFRGGILDFKATGSIGFLDGIEGYKQEWKGLILNENIKEKLIEGTDGFLKNYNYEEWKRLGIPMNQGLLVYGPPGTGKTLLGKILISNILKKDYPQSVTYIHIQSRHINSLESIRRIFQVARELSPVILFFEDIDLIAGTDRNDRAQIKNELMQQLSGIEELNGVLTIGTTNVEEKIDPALKRSKRLGLHFLFGLPVYNERVKLFSIFCRSDKVNVLQYDQYANQSEGFTGADIKQICQSAVDVAINDKIRNKKSKLDLSHDNILSALKLRQKTRLNVNSRVMGVRK